jgi:hypothetical protein
MSATSKISIAMATEEHAGAIAAFYREVWDANATQESVLAAMRLGAIHNVAAAGVQLPVALVFSGTRIVGYCGSIAQRLWDGAEERPAYWVKGLMVLRDYRNGPVGYLAVRELTSRLPCATVLTVAPAARRLFAALGYRDLGAVHNWVKPLRPGVIANQLDLEAVGLRSLPRWVGSGVRIAQRTGAAALVAQATGAGMEAFSSFSRLTTSHFEETVDEAPSREDLDAVWMEARSNLKASPVRDGNYLVTRFGAHSSHEQANPYKFIAIRERGRLVSVAALRNPRMTPDPRLGTIRVATISDLVFPLTKPQAGLATLGAIATAARGGGADAVTCMTSHRGIGRLLKRQGYLRLSGNVHFFLRDVNAPEHWPTDLSSWWLGRGDGESDATF